MKLSKAVVGAIAVFTTGVLSQDVICDGRAAPDYDACDEIIAAFDVSQNLPYSYPNCLNFDFTGDDGPTNCIISVCPLKSDAPVSYEDVSVGESVVKSDCGSANSGGIYNRDPDFTVQATNNPDYNPPSKRSSLVASKHPRDFSGSIAERQAAGDTGYVVIVKQEHVEVPAYGHIVTGRLTAGSTYTTTTENSMTQGVETSVGAMAGFFDIFAASAMVTTTEESTITSSVGIQVLVDCAEGQYGEVYWYPLFTIYEGYFTPSNTNQNYYIPEDTAESDSNYHVTCLSN